MIYDNPDPPNIKSPEFTSAHPKSTRFAPVPPLNPYYAPSAFLRAAATALGKTTVYGFTATRVAFIREHAAF
ncbi:hypothetical protein WA026_004823, partial [Henosepilachna vigintioctopunctata]